MRNMTDFDESDGVEPASAEVDDTPQSSRTFKSFPKDNNVHRFERSFLPPNIGVTFTETPERPFISQFSLVGLSS